MPQYNDFDLDIQSKSDIITTSVHLSTTRNSICVECDYTQQSGCCSEYYICYSEYAC